MQKGRIKNILAFIIQPLILGACDGMNQTLLCHAEEIEFEIERVNSPLLLELSQG